MQKSNHVLYIDLYPMSLLANSLQFSKYTVNNAELMACHYTALQCAFETIWLSGHMAAWPPG